MFKYKTFTARIYSSSQILASSFFRGKIIAVMFSILTGSKEIDPNNIILSFSDTGTTKEYIIHETPMSLYVQPKEKAFAPRQFFVFLDHDLEEGHTLIIEGKHKEPEYFHAYTITGAFVYYKDESTTKK